MKRYASSRGGRVCGDFSPRMATPVTDRPTVVTPLRSLQRLHRKRRGASERIIMMYFVIVAESPRSGERESSLESDCKMRRGLFVPSRTQRSRESVRSPAANVERHQHMQLLPLIFDLKRMNCCQSHRRLWVTRPQQKTATRHFWLGREPRKS